MSGVSGSDPQRSIFLVPHPKIVFLYPTFIAAVLAGIHGLVAREPAGQTAHMVSLAFLIIFGLNLVVIAFDFPRTTSLTLFFAVTAFVIGLILLFTFYPDLWPRLHEWIRALNPLANPTYYFLLAGILFLLYLAVWIDVHFDYWEVRQNELLHHHGVWSNLERFAAPSLRIDKEINDVFEYLLLRSGRLVLHPSDEPRAIVLDNVFFINKKEAELTKLLGSLQVQVKTDDH
jgi:hypothetical protein